MPRLTGKDAADFINERQRSGVKAATVPSALAAHSHLYTVARSAWGMPYLGNPVQRVKSSRPKSLPGQERRLQRNEESRLFAAASPEFAAIIHFALATAMRRSGIAAMRWELVDLKRRAVLHQVQAALFAFSSPFTRAALLADEVGLGKTMEVGLVLSRKWAEHKRRILVITPSNLRKQWLQELTEKFFLPCLILESKSYNAAIRQGQFRPF